VQAKRGLPGLLHRDLLSPRAHERGASMLVSWLQAEHGDLIKQADRARYLAALDELPNNAPSPRVFYVSIYDQDIEPHWRVTFTLDHTAHESSLRQPTEAAATEYASSFLASWAKMSGR
jgi:hypothetical protein